jgi:hypothetical protein
MSQNFFLTASQFIVQAYAKLGVLPEGATPTNDQYTKGMVALNAMLKGWQADGINVFRQAQVQIVLPAGVPMVTIVPQVVGIEDARWVQNQGTPYQFERPMGKFTYSEYMNLPNKLSQSSSGPSSYMLDKQVSQSNLYVYPCATFGGQINSTVARMANDVVNPNDPVDVPQEWTEGVEFNLADRLMDNHGVAAADPATASRIEERAVAFYTKLLSFDRPTSVKMKPWGRRGSGKFWKG